MRVLVVVVLGLVVGAAGAAVVEDCNKLSGKQRLACYDWVLGVPSQEAFTPELLIDPPRTSHEAAPGLAPIEDGAISRRIGCDNGCERSNAYARYAPYLAWAAEVARRLPNCAAVITVALSLDRSTQSEPVFYVTCDAASRRIRDAFNTWYSKTELDHFRLSAQP